MKKHMSRILLVFLITSMISAPGFSQNDEQAVQSKESRTEGLKKLTSIRYDHDFDIRFDSKELEASIEAAIADALRSVEVALEKLEITIEPIEIRLENLNMNLNPVVVNIPHFNIEIEPVEIELEDIINEEIELDIDIDHGDFGLHDNHHEWSDGGDHQKDHDKDKHKEKHQKNKQKQKADKKSDKSDLEENDKTKGLKKIN